MAYITLSNGQQVFIPDDMYADLSQLPPSYVNQVLSNPQNVQRLQGVVQAHMNTPTGQNSSVTGRPVSQTGLSGLPTPQASQDLSQVIQKPPSQTTLAPIAGSQASYSGWNPFTNPNPSSSQQNITGSGRLPIPTPGQTGTAIPGGGVNYNGANFYSDWSGPNYVNNANNGSGNLSTLGTNDYVQVGGPGANVGTNQFVNSSGQLGYLDANGKFTQGTTGGYAPEGTGAGQANWSNVQNLQNYVPPNYTKGQ